MKIASVVLAGLLATLAMCGNAADPLVPIPELHARVTDLSGSLDPARRQAIENRLAALEQRKGAQIAVLLVPATAPEPIEAYATRTFDAWKLGRKGIDDGVLILVAKDDRRVRIEVGYGLEGAIPDAAAKRVMHDYMSPRFAAGDFAGGLVAGIDWLTRLIDGEPLPAARPAAAVSSHSNMRLDPREEPWWSPLQLVVGILFGAFLGVILVLILGRPRPYRFVLGRLPERARVYAFGALDAIPIALLMRHPMAALGAFAAGGTLASMIGLSKAPRRGGRGFGSGGDGSSGGGGSPGGGSDSSGGGFSGGGGSSGGGGASDSW